MGRGQPQTVDALYAAAVEDLEAGLYPEALKEFGEIKAKHPYSRFAALADLRTADTHFKRAKYQEAIDAYRNFLKFHPNHEDAAYAMFNVGEAYTAQIPGDWWFLPPSVEKDQVSTRLAIGAYEDMLARFSSGPMAEAAQAHCDAARRRLADHEMYVAQFYLKRARYEAAALRAEGLLQDYPGLGLDVQALWIVGKARLARGDRAAAEAALRRLAEEFPDSQEGHEARRLIDAAKPAPKPSTPEAPGGPAT